MCESSSCLADCGMDCELRVKRGNQVSSPVSWAEWSGLSSSQSDFASSPCGIDKLRYLTLPFTEDDALESCECQADADFSAVWDTLDTLVRV